MACLPGFIWLFLNMQKYLNKLKTSVQVGKIQAAEWEHSSHRFCWGEQKTIPFVSVFSHHTPHYTTRMWAAIAERTAARRKTGYDFFIFFGSCHLPSSTLTDSPNAAAAYLHGLALRSHRIVAKLSSCLNKHLFSEIGDFCGQPVPCHWCQNGSHLFHNHYFWRQQL